MSRKRSWLMKRIWPLPVFVQTRFCRRVVIQGPMPRNMSTQKPTTRTGSTHIISTSRPPSAPALPKLVTMYSAISAMTPANSRNGLIASR